MITQIQNLPANMVGFKATNEVTQEDFTNKVIPTVKELVEKTDTLNYMLVLDTSVKDFTAGAWFKDAVLGVKNLTKWNRAAIVSDEKGVKTFTDVFSVLVPGEFKVFEHKDQQKAIDWVSGLN
ncbi:STAS/SEC14 domain-containing protein [Cytophaga hutchinsonii]|uniref:STAS/SEC14 domain-containing protein n=1 Tax=Cytophaga hutchinsonii (strain ATCC 33406 / DSM 1761 / CIP 103989 / NBRC 15051 / NCIMB 9469 / D465) TaxID=269798 RepID=A0A6N4SQC7_CYTH3|nr:STAS/SEC14 domain-containing protein [Cytophaga hutchinsonii]ABG58520.1 conserved hypothetical protein [Cytophaga hutchinsonii ATCC 33406]SFX76164.1 SpoIIAA-like [Cytophaga hutchinsonii ATCC 33406]